MYQKAQMYGTLKRLREAKYSTTFYVRIGQVQNDHLYVYLNEEVEYKKGGPGAEMPACHGEDC